MIGCLLSTEPYDANELEDLPNRRALAPRSDQQAHSDTPFLAFRYEKER